MVLIIPLLIFQRMSIAKKSEKKLENFLTYEVSYFLSLFSNNGMRKWVESSIYQPFEQHFIDINFEDTMY